MSLDAQRTAETTDPVCSTIRMMFPGPLIGGTRSWWGGERRVTHLRELRGSYTRAQRGGRGDRALTMAAVLVP